MFQLTVELDPKGKTPMYEQLYQYFTAEIRAGRLCKGEKLPSKRALCSHLGISRSTVETAYGLLTAEGYLTAKPQSGYYVSDFAVFDSTDAGRAPEENKTPDLEPARTAGPDFSTASVDVSLFPYSSWAKLNKETVYGQPELLQRGNRQGDLTLRTALCSFLAQYRGVKCSPEQVVVGAGQEYISELLLQLLPREGVCGVEDPGYATLAQTIRAFGRELRYLPQDRDGVTVDALEAAGVDIAFITPSHQFPLGITMPAGRRSQLLRWSAEGRERYLVEDDYDSEFRYGTRPIPAMQGMDLSGRVVYIGTFSRSLAPSIRIAYAVLPPALLKRYNSLEGYRYSTVSRYEQAVMARFLSEGFYARYLRRVGNLYRRRRELLISALEAIPGVRVSGSGGGIHFLLTNPRYSEPELLSRALHRGVALRGLSAYCRRVTPAPSTLVMGYGGLGDDCIRAAVQTLADAWA